LGLIWLAIVAKPAAGFSAALRTGLYPFLAADLLKLFIAAAVMPAIWRLVGRRDSGD
jgi:biotin transporter BioY